MRYITIKEFIGFNDYIIKVGTKINFSSNYGDFMLGGEVYYLDSYEFQKFFRPLKDVRKERLKKINEDRN